MQANDAALRFPEAAPGRARSSSTRGRSISAKTEPACLRDTSQDAGAIATAPEKQKQRPSHKEAVS